MPPGPEHAGVGELLIRYPGGEAGTKLFSGLICVGMGLLTVPLIVAVWGDNNGHPQPTDDAIQVTVFFLLCSAFFAWPAARSLIPWWRITRGAWWLRLTPEGLEINARMGRPERYRWCDVERFFLAPTPIDLHATESASVDWSRGLPVTRGRVPAFRLVPQYRRSFWHRRINRIYRSWHGPVPDGLIAEYWDRPLDQAVALLDEWHRRYRAWDRLQ